MYWRCTVNIDRNKMKKLIYRLSYIVVGMTLVMSGYVPMGGGHSFASATTLAPSANTVTTYVTKKAVDMKAGKHRKNKTLNTIPKGKTVTHVKSYGSWTQVKYGSKTGYVPTSSLGNKKVVTVKPVPKPTPGLTPAEKDKVMSAVFEKTSGDASGGQYELTHYVSKTGFTWELGGAGIEFPTGQGYMSFGVGSYGGAYARSDTLGKEAQAEAEKVYAKYNDAIYAFASVTIGKEHGETLKKEFEMFFLTPSSGTVKVTKTIGGRKVIFGADSLDYTIDVD